VTGKKGRSKKKISSEFSARLARLGPGDKVHAFVLLRTGTTSSRSSKRQDRSEREAAVKAARKSAERALTDIDKILKRHDGRRLARRPNALGSMPVETTAAGIKALARSRSVQAVLEDQPIRLSG
jgi:hypothetical protein